MASQRVLLENISAQEGGELEDKKEPTLGCEHEEYAEDGGPDALVPGRTVSSASPGRSPSPRLGQGFSAPLAP